MLIISVKIATPDISQDDIPWVFIIHTIIPPEFIASYFVFYLKVLDLSTRRVYHRHLGL
jgi:hypothetical protein